MSPSTSQVPNITFRGDVEIPQLGFGVFQVPPAQTTEIATRALLAGYRHLDTAGGVPQRGGRRAGGPRRGPRPRRGLHHDEVLQRHHGYDQAKRALKDSLDRLEMEYVDLYLIHWPVPRRTGTSRRGRALIELQKQGLARAIGVSNFQPAHLERIIAETGVRPWSTRSSCIRACSSPACAASTPTTAS